MKRSECITGRRDNAKAFKIAKQKHLCFVVGAYTINDGKTFYSDQSYLGPRKDVTARMKSSTRCLYRIIVTPK